MLRKIIKWVSGNQQPSEELIESTSSETHKAENNINIDVDDDVLSFSRGETELDSSLLLRNNSVDSAPCAFEAKKNIDASIKQDSIVTVIEVAPNSPLNGCNPNESKEIFPDEDSKAAEITPIDNQTCGTDEIDVGKREFLDQGCQTTAVLLSDNQTFRVDRNMGTDCWNPISKPSSLSSSTSKKTSVVNFRDFWTQTSDKRDNSLKMKHALKNNFPQKLNDRTQKILLFSAAGAARSNNRPSLAVREKSEDASGSVVYGTLYVVGCNKAVPKHLVRKMSAKYVLRKRREANGVKEAFSYVSANKTLCMNSGQHVISYRLSENRSVVAVFKQDSSSDMFQIGRYEEPALDFRVIDTNPPEKARNGVSRFACRILVHRDGIHEARVYAAAFDSSQAISVRDSAMPSSHSEKMDGFTTNGVLIMHPGKKDNPGVWREVSVSGFIYPLRSDPKKHARIPQESNVLEDGTMVDLCGVTLLWRTPEGLKKAPNEEFLCRLQSTLERSVPCFDLRIQPPNLRASEANWVAKKAFVYTSCGHVVGLSLPKLPKNPQRWLCPVCRVMGPLVELKIGAEPGFCADREFPSHAFKPCGHAASLETVKYWASTQIPDHRSSQVSHCPFCGVKLNFINQYVELILPVA